MTSRETRHRNTNLPDHSAGRIGRAINLVRQEGILEPLRLVRRHGIAESGRFILRNSRHLIADHLARQWDRIHGVDTAGSIRLDSLDVVGPNRSEGNECICTSPKSFNFIMRNLPIELENYTFIDIGSGKSRTLLLASHYPFCSIVGIEFAREFVTIARHNIGTYKSARQKCASISVVEADAAAYEFPETPLVVYFYNPFSKDIFDIVLRNLAHSLDQVPRECFLIYGSSSHNAIDWAKPKIRACGLFEELATPPMPLFLDAVRTIDYAVFEHHLAARL